MYKKNVASQSIYFVMVGVVAPASPVTGATVTAKRSIDGGTQADCTGSIVEDGNGQYHLVTSQADVNGNNIGFLFTTGGSYPVSINVVTADGSGIWDVPTANHTATGSTGKAIGDAASGIVPNTIAAALWNYLTSAITTAGSIGKLLKDNLDVAVSSRLSEADYTGAANGDIALIKAKTDNLPGAPAAVSDIPTAIAVADALLDRSNGVEASWTPRQALRVILAALAGKVSGAATSTVVIRDVGDSKNRVTATCDVDGNRTAATYDKS
jgi:hypothetical protein